jgi:glycosyltransferase involved in cell wall biosynthesis
MPKKKISIIMNCYNSEKFLKDALQSILLQNYENWELIFYDNQSNDKSYQIYKSFKDKRFKYYKSKKFEKLGVARKKALSKAKGEFVVFFDSDDILLKNKLHTQLKFFSNKNVGFVITNSLFFNDKRSKILFNSNKIFEKNIFYKLIENYFISFDTVMMRLSFIKKLDHGLDERFNIIHDMDLLTRLSKISEMRYVPTILSKWRMRDDSLSYNSYINIINEKKIFIKKINKKFKSDQKFLKSKAIFMDALYRQEILYSLTKKNYKNIYRLVKKLKFNFKNFILIFLIFVPFKRYIFKNLLNIKF